MCQAGLLPPHPDSRLSLEVPASLCPWPTLPKSPTPQAGLGLSHFVHLRRLEELSRVRPAPGSLSPVSPMSPAASTQGKDWMVWKASLLPLLLLPLLIPGSWALPEAQHLHRVAGQTLSVTCRYTPKGWPYQRKGWCKEVSPFKCTRLVSSSSPHKLVQASRFSIWDNPSTGLFIVTMIGLKEEDSGYYWCRIYHASSNSVSKSVRFYLAVSPGHKTPPSTLQPPALWCPCSVPSLWPRAWCYRPCLSGEWVWVGLRGKWGREQLLSLDRESDRESATKHRGRTSYTQQSCPQEPLTGPSIVHAHYKAHLCLLQT
uniref:Ig-like domain-containing protein n=1 Tax=Canis lupus familiaris TaxID=9615 RepID=A0A8I3NMD0_CANLF